MPKHDCQIKMQILKDKLKKHEGNYTVMLLTNSITVQLLNIKENSNLCLKRIVRSHNENCTLYG